MSAADSGTSIPVASALFTYTSPDGVLVSQAGVDAAEPIFSGRIFVDDAGAKTGVALANLSQQNASVTLILRDLSGKEIARKSQPMGPGKHLPLYLYQLFSGMPSSFTGSLTFESDQKLASIALRESRNAYGEPLYATLPVVDLSAPAGSSPLVFPQIAAGGGYTTQIILINGGSQTLRGHISLWADDGNPLPLLLNGSLVTQFAYEVPPQGTYRALLGRSELQAGYALVTPDAGNGAPAGTAIFQFNQSGFVVTEAAVTASPWTTSARIFVDTVDSFTGVAIANRENAAAAVTFALLDQKGAAAGSTVRTLPPRGHLAVFAHELFPDLQYKRLTGLMEISCATAIAPITLKLSINKRNELVYTTLPVADLTQPPCRFWN